MGSLRPGVRLHEYAAEAYDEEVERIVRRLHQCAEDVQKRGLYPSKERVAGAMAVITTVTAAIANLGMDRLIQLAHQADPPADTPAVLLDRAAGGIMAALHDEDEDRAVELAEAALRGAGVIR